MSRLDIQLRTNPNSKSRIGRQQSVRRWAFHHSGVFAIAPKTHAKYQRAPEAPGKTWHTALSNSQVQLAYGRWIFSERFEEYVWNTYYVFTPFIMSHLTWKQWLNRELFELSVIFKLFSITAESKNYLHYSQRPRVVKFGVYKFVNIFLSLNFAFRNFVFSLSLLLRKTPPVFCLFGCVELQIVFKVTAAICLPVLGTFRFESVL